jgi:tetratricopeptide (TPR) repeat protein
VGLDNLGQVATFYRDSELAKQEGIWTIPDRTHNVPLDHLVNGGVLAFVLWIVFISIITILAFRKIFRKIGVASPVIDFSVCLIWFGYLFQSLISVDHIFLTLIGYLSAGLIFGDYLYERNNHKSYGKRFVPFFLVAQITLVGFMINQLILSYNVNQFLNRGNTQVLDKIYNTRFIEQQSFLDTVVKLSGDKQFKLAALFSEKLLIVNPYAHQAYYAKSVFYESEKDLIKAKREMEKAHTYDKFNSVYTLSLGIYEYNLKNYPKAYYWLTETAKLNPTQQGIEILKNSLDQLDS